jgi:hypothetical protein
MAEGHKRKCREKFGVPFKRMGALPPNPRQKVSYTLYFPQKLRYRMLKINKFL